ncbi:hypothetical protein ACFW5S_12730 [Streptomyces olivaceus]|uniref:hypothetical protein n=1 Tax=Streptomyces olivaceus TaxID=47716 RepID=UPI00368DD460
MGRLQGLVEGHAHDLLGLDAQPLGERLRQLAPPHRPAEVGGDDEGPARELLTAVAVGVQGGGHQVFVVAQGDRVGEAAGDEQALQDVEGALPSVRARPKISVSLGGCASGAAASAIGVMASQGGESWSPVASSTGAYWPCSRPSAWPPPRRARL